MELKPTVDLKAVRKANAVTTQKFKNAAKSVTKLGLAPADEQKIEDILTGALNQQLSAQINGSEKPTDGPPM